MNSSFVRPPCLLVCAALLTGCGHPERGDLFWMSSVGIGFPLMFILASIRSVSKRMAGRPAEGTGATERRRPSRAVWGIMSFGLALAGAYAMHMWLVDVPSMFQLERDGLFWLGAFFQISCALLAMSVIILSGRLVFGSEPSAPPET